MACCTCVYCVERDSWGYFVSDSLGRYSFEVKISMQVQRKKLGYNEEKEQWVSTYQNVPVGCTCGVAKMQV